MGKRASQHGTDRQESQTPRRRRSAGAGHDYVITVVGEILLDIDESVSTAHASAISANRATPDAIVPAASRPRKGV